METKTAEEIYVESYVKHPGSLLGGKEDFLKEFILKPTFDNEVAIAAMKAYASQAVRLALEEVGSLAAYRPTYIDKSSILSLADSIIGKLK